MILHFQGNPFGKKSEEEEPDPEPEEKSGGFFSGGLFGRYETITVYSWQVQTTDYVILSCLVLVFMVDAE